MRNCCRHASVGLGLALSLVLAGCATRPSGPDGLTRIEQAELQRRERQLHASPQRVRDARLEAYLQRLLMRLGNEAPAMRIHVLDRPAARADLLGGQVVLLHLRLLVETRNEAELAFVLAHELAHRRLGHVAARRRADWDADAAELAADGDAVQTLQRLGYRVSAGRELLRRLLETTRAPAARALIEVRIQALPATDAGATAATDGEFEAATAPYRSRGDARSTD